MSGKLIVFFMIFALAQAAWLDSFDPTKLSEKVTQSTNPEGTSDKTGTNNFVSKDTLILFFNVFKNNIPLGQSNGTETTTDGTGTTNSSPMNKITAIIKEWKNKIPVGQSNTPGATGTDTGTDTGIDGSENEPTSGGTGLANEITSTYT